MPKITLTEDQRKFLEKNPNAVICFETGVVYPNANAVARSMRLSKSGVYGYIRGTRQSPVAGYTFDYLERLKGRRF